MGFQKSPLQKCSRFVAALWLNTFWLGPTVRYRYLGAVHMLPHLQGLLFNFRYLWKPGGFFLPIVFLSPFCIFGPFRPRNAGPWTLRKRRRRSISIPCAKSADLLPLCVGTALYLILSYGGTGTQCLMECLARLLPKTRVPDPDLFGRIWKIFNGSGSFRIL